MFLVLVIKHFPLCKKKEIKERNFYCGINLLEKMKTEKEFFPQIIHHPFKFSKYLLNLPNHTLWAKIYDHIHHKNLTLVVAKVLAHSNDPLNDRADALAKEATND